MSLSGDELPTTSLVLLPLSGFSFLVIIFFLNYVVISWVSYLPH